MFQVHEHSNCACPLCCPEKYASGNPPLVFPNDSIPVKPPISYGWCCPKCESIYAPSIAKCWTCGPSLVLVGNTEVNITS